MENAYIGKETSQSANKYNKLCYSVDMIGAEGEAEVPLQQEVEVGVRKV